MENFLAPVVLHEVNGVRHEICRTCAKDYFERRRKDHGEEEGSPCPYCKVIVPAPDVLPSNLVGILGEDLDKAAPWLEPPNAESWLVDTETPVGSVFAALAAYHGMLSVLELVATNTACDLRMKYGGGKTLMHFAASGRRPDVVRWLFANGYESMAADACDGGLLPLHCASRSGDALTVEFLIRRPGAVELYQSEPHGTGDVEGGGGWVDELLKSKYERVQIMARNHLEHKAKQAANVALPKLIREGADLDDIVALRPALLKVLADASHRDLFHEEGTPPPRDIWAETMELATEFGRVDLVRWMYASKLDAYDYRLTEHVFPRHSYDEITYEPIVTPTYEEHGRALAAKYDKPEFLSLYDELLQAIKDTKKARELDKELVRLVEVGANVEEIEAADKLGRTLISGIPDDLREDLKEERPLKLGLRYHMNAKYAECGHYSDKFAIPSVGNFTMLNFIAVVGHLHLLEWVLLNHVDWKWPSEHLNPLTTVCFNPSFSYREMVERMLSRSICHAHVSENAPLVQRRLIGWLATLRAKEEDDPDHHLLPSEAHLHSAADRLVDDMEPDRFVAAIRVHRFAHDDRERSPDKLSEDIHRPHSLLDEAIHSLVYQFREHRPEGGRAPPDEVAIGRLWDAVDLLATLKPPPPIDFTEIIDNLTNVLGGCGDIPSDEEFAQCEVHVLRLLKFCERLGIDLTASITRPRRGNNESIPLSHKLVECRLMECLAWLVDTYNVNVQGLNLDRLSANEPVFMGWTHEPSVKEKIEGKLAAIQAAQRQRDQGQRR